MAYFDLSKLSLAKANVLKASNPNCHGERRNKVALRTTCIKNVKFKIIKIRTGCEYVRYFYHSENNINWAEKKLRLGHMLAAGWT